MKRLKLVPKALFYHRFSGTTHVFGTAVTKCILWRSPYFL